MLPGISSEDCLFADLCVDPATVGCQSFEATDFLTNARRIDTTSSLILWQIGVVGETTFKKGIYDLSALPLLVERLLQYYPSGHVVYLYEAAVFPGCEPTILPVPIQALGRTPLSPVFTLYVPPAYRTTTDPEIYYHMNAAAAHSAGR
jgi:hypothetical protein